MRAPARKRGVAGVPRRQNAGKYHGRVESEAVRHGHVPDARALCRRRAETERYRSLYDWDYVEAWGAKDYAGSRTIDDAERALIEDAFRRKNLAVLEGNRKCLDDVVSARVRAAVPAPIDRTDEGWEAYCEACRQTECHERDALYPILHVVLNETAGVLLRGLLEAATQAGPTFLRQCDRQGLRYGLTPFFAYSEMPAHLAQSRSSRLWSQLYSEV